MPNPAISQIKAEFNGVLSRSIASSNGRDFALVLSMLHCDITQRGNLTSSDPAVTPDAQAVSLAHLDHYPKTPLSVQSQHWYQYQKVATAVSQQDTATVRLLQCMYPAPLSQQDDPLHIAPEVVLNCDVFCQQRMRNQGAADIEEDAVLLNDLIPQTQDLLRDFGADELAVY